jgi:hypothetical protein
VDAPRHQAERRYGLANICVQPHVVEQILNHQSGHKRGTAGIYNRSVYTNEVRAALALWSDHVRTLVEGGERIASLPPFGRDLLAR